MHLTLRRGLDTPLPAVPVTDGRALLQGVQAAQGVLAAGVTTVRDCAARGHHAQELRDAVEDRIIAGPRILASGPPITTTAGHIWRLGYEADSVTEVRRAVRRLVKEGVDFIKVCATGGRGTPGSVIGRAQYSTDELRAIVEDAHRLGRHVATHALGTEGIRRAVEAGIDTIEHCAWLDLDGETLAFDEAVVESMAVQGLVASIAAGPPWEVFHQDKELAGNSSPPTTVARLDTMQVRWRLIQRMRELGVQVCLATDSVYGMFEDYHDLSYLAQALGGLRGLSTARRDRDADGGTGACHRLGRPYRHYRTRQARRSAGRQGQSHRGHAGTTRRRSGLPSGRNGDAAIACSGYPVCSATRPGRLVARYPRP